MGLGKLLLIPKRLLGRYISAYGDESISKCQNTHPASSTSEEASELFGNIFDLTSSSHHAIHQDHTLETFGKPKILRNGLLSLKHTPEHLVST